jgi:hypothetical protein
MSVGKSDESINYGPNFDAMIINNNIYKKNGMLTSVLVIFEDKE